MSIKVIPSFKIEHELQAQGLVRIVGVDEAGCGALAGPVVAGAVILPLDFECNEVRDSKLLSEQKREDLYLLIVEGALAWATGSASVKEIEELNIRGATLLAMCRAVEAIEQVDFALVDAWTIPGVSCPQRGIIRGDQTVMSIAAASIIAKVTRDRIMRELDLQYPEYGFQIHKGYGTRVHQEAIREHGACAIHRLSYKTFQYDRIAP
ncbi:MAG: ribonuclease HII [Patescibacteria group bacterium]